MDDATRRFRPARTARLVLAAALAAALAAPCVALASESMTVSSGGAAARPSVVALSPDDGTSTLSASAPRASLTLSYDAGAGIPSGTALSLEAAFPASGDAAASAVMAANPSVDLSRMLVVRTRLSASDGSAIAPASLSRARETLTATLPSSASLGSVRLWAVTGDGVAEAMLVASASSSDADGDAVASASEVSCDVSSAARRDDGSVLITRGFSPATLSTLVLTWDDARTGAAASAGADGSGASSASEDSGDSSSAAAATAVTPDDGDDLTSGDLISAALVEAPRIAALPSVRRAEQARASAKSEGDGSKIESVSVGWVTKDSPSDDGDDARLLVTPSGDASFSVQLRISLAVLGQHDYAAGELRVVVPGDVLKGRDGQRLGTWTLSVPEDPSHKALFSYVERDDGSFIITNTRRIPAATQAMFEMSLRDITPHEVVGNPDAYETDPLSATVELTTASGEELSLTSDSITARFDTSERVSSATERVINWQAFWPSSWPAELKPENPDDYVYVDFYSYARQDGNQAYSMSEAHTVSSDDLPGGIALGMRDGNGTLYKGDGTDTVSAKLSEKEYSPYSPTHYAHLYAAWPKAGLSSSSVSTFGVRDEVTHSLTSADDGQLTQASASASTTIAFMPYVTPEGHFWTEKSGNDVDPVGLNRIDSGSDASVGYSVTMRGFTGPWTWVDADGDGNATEDELGKRSVTFDGLDVPLTLDGQALATDDYDLPSVSLGKPSVYDYVRYDSYGYGYREPNASYGSSSVSYGEIPTGSWGYRASSDDSAVPDEEVLAYVGGAWTSCGAVSWKSGSPVLSGAASGVSLDGSRLTLPVGTKRLRVRFETKAAAVIAKFSPTVAIHSTDATRDVARKALVGSETPTSLVVNQATGTFSQSETGQVITSIVSAATDRLQGAFQGARLVKSLDSYDNDTESRVVRLHYSATVREQTNVTSASDVASAVAAGALTDETSGTFYDLLPTQVVPDLSSVRMASSGDSVTGVRAVSNWRGSGRTLLVVSASLTPDRRWCGRGQQGNVLGQDGLLDSHQVLFDATYTWEAMTDYGATLANVAAFESGNSWIGNTGNLVGEPDDPAHGSHVDSAQATDGVASLMTDLDPNRGDPSFVYARDVTTLAVDTAALTSLTKRVSVNASGIYSDGLGADELNVYESGRYDYRLRVQNDSATKSQDVVIYDSLENYVPTEDKDDHGDEQWRGSLRSIDVSQIKAAGVAPRVYVSRSEGLVLDDTGNRADMNLSDGSKWSEVAFSALSDLSSFDGVTAVAIDCSKASDGSDFTLDVDESLVAYLRMKAPSASSVSPDDPSRAYDLTLSDGQHESDDDGWVGGAHAYNNVSMLSTSISARTGLRSENQLVRNDYVKVGLIPFKVRVTKSFDDADDADGLRPLSVTIRLLADGVDTGKSATLSDENSWTVEFDGVPAVNDDGDPVSYAVSENGADGYSASCSQSYDESAHVMEVSVTNRHERVMTSLAGTKAWDDEGHEDARPSSVTIALLRDGEQVATTRASAAGGWKWSFTGLPRYHDHGKEYAYAVVEDGYYAGYVPEVDGTTVTNRYDPYGDIEISKQVRDATDASKGSMHSFSVTLTSSDGTPDAGSYEYLTSDGRSGTISNGGTLELAGGQTATISRVPSETSYSVTETPAAGYSVFSSEGASGQVMAGRVAHASFVDRYDASGSVVIRARKELSGRSLARNQFRFSVTLSDDEGHELRSATNDADGNVTFGRIRYGLSDVGKTYTYEIRETDDGRDGYSYDSHVERVSVAVTDNGDGTLSATPTYSSKDGATFHNSYDASGSLALRAWKVVTGGGAHALKAGEFSFELDDADGNAVATATNEADGTVAFPALTFDQDDAGKTFTYVAREIAGTDATVIYTDKAYTYTVKVYDDGDGTLSFDQTADERPVFENGLKPGSLRLSKLVSGDNPTPGRTFRFHVRMTAPDGVEIPDGPYQVQRAEKPKLSVPVRFTVTGSDAPTLNWRVRDAATGQALVYFDVSATLSDSANLPAGSYVLECTNPASGWKSDPVEFSVVAASDGALSLHAGADGSGNAIDAVEASIIGAHVGKYAVSPYGIGVDHDASGNVMGITFGPATGDEWGGSTSKVRTQTRHHDVAGGTEQPEGQPALTTASDDHAIVGADAGTDDVGNAYRCIHYDDWNTIIYWNHADPHVYDKCVSRGCSHAVEITYTDAQASAMSSTRPGGTDRPFLHMAASFAGGDGPDAIGLSFWDLQNSGVDITVAGQGYSASLIRAKLVGADSMTKLDEKYAGTDALTKFAGSNNYLACFPRELREAIGAKDLNYTNTLQSFYADARSNGDACDKLWLMSYKEISGKVIYPDQNRWSAASERRCSTWFWLRSPKGSNLAWYIYGDHGLYLSGVADQSTVSPCFALVA